VIKRLMLVVALVLVSVSAFAQGLTDAQFATLKAERAKYAAAILTPEEIGIVLNATAWKHRNDAGARLGMQAKPSGTASVQPKTGTRIWNGLRIVAADGSHWGEDVCGGCSVGQFNPVRATPGPADKNTFVAPVETGVTPPPPPPVDPPVDPPAPVTSAATADLQQQQLTLLLQIVAKLDAQLTAQQEQSTKLEAAIRDLKAEIAKGIKVRF
jgi:hypothetical protein